MKVLLVSIVLLGSAPTMAEQVMLGGRPVDPCLFCAAMQAYQQEHWCAEEMELAGTRAQLLVERVREQAEQQARELVRVYEADRAQLFSRWQVGLALGLVAFASALAGYYGPSLSPGR